MSDHDSCSEPLLKKTKHTNSTTTIMQDDSKMAVDNDDWGMDDSSNGWDDAANSQDDNNDDNGDWGDSWENADDSHVDLPRPKLKRQSSYLILEPDQILDLQNTRLAETVDLLGVDKDTALILLRHFQWNKDKLTAKYFANEHEAQVEAGVVPQSKQAPSTEPEVECPMCYDDFAPQDMYHLECGHQICKPCWKDYLTDAVGTGPQSCMTRCPHHGCNLIVPENVFKSFLTQPLFDKYSKWARRNFIQGERSLCWCPAAGCDRAVEYPDCGAHEICCPAPCNYKFCFKCSTESHRPSTCSDAKKWRIKANSESENVTWILANTKTCPKCQAQIEKNQGCNHMTCRACKHDFCWLCKGPWKDHGSASGGYYRCNKFEEAKTKGSVSAEDAEAEKAKNELQRYMHFFQRFDAHDSSLKHAQKSFLRCETRMEELQNLKGGGLNDVQFLVDALMTVVECRRLLKWTYVHGYYMEDQNEKALFEQAQEQLEKHTEYLNELTDKPLEDLIDDKIRPDINNRVRVVSKFRENIINGIEGGLTDESTL